VLAFGLKNHQYINMIKGEIADTSSLYDGYKEDDYGAYDSEDAITRGDPPIRFVPNKIHYEFTYQCPNNCRDCIAPKQSLNGDELSVEQFHEILDEAVIYTDDDSIEEVLITGGEPGMRTDLTDLVNGIHERGIEIGLSTTGHDPYNQLPQILSKLSSIGIPIDGPTPYINSLWRGHGPGTETDGGLQIAIDALLKIQNEYPDLETKVRTLLNPSNIDYVMQIPNFLISKGIDISRLRWTIYEQYQRYSVPDLGSSMPWWFQPDMPNPNLNHFLVSSKSIDRYIRGTDKFSEDIDRVGRKFSETTVRTIGDVAFRYCIISPNGEFRSVIKTTENTRYPIVEEPFGNIYTDFIGTMKWFCERDAYDLAHYSATAYSYFFENLEDIDGKFI